MPYTAWPTEHDVTEELKASGLITGSLRQSAQNLNIEAPIAAAIEEWEQMTRFEPFLSDGIASTRVFDGTGSNVLDLDGGLWSLTSFTLNGTVYTAGTQFKLKPDNAAAKKRPYTYIWFGDPSRNRFMGWDTFGSGLLGFLPNGSGIVSIEGIWGWLEIPADAWYTVLNRAVSKVLPKLGVKAFGGVVSWSEGDAREQYSEKPFATMMSNEEFTNTAMRYRRFSC